MTEPYSGERGCLSIVMLEFLGRIYWNYFAIGYIVVGAFTLLAGLFAFTIKDRSRATFPDAHIPLMLDSQDPSPASASNEASTAPSGMITEHRFTVFPPS
jgi:hypothetical protein